MADKAKFEEMLEHLVNNDREKAEELFHEIVVEKSRDIYENLLADDVEDKEVDEASKDEDIDEKAKEDDEETNEASKDKKKMPKDGEDKVADADANKDTDKTNEDFDLDEFEVEGGDDMGGMDAMMGGDASDDMELDMGGDMMTWATAKMMMHLQHRVILKILKQNLKTLKQSLKT